MVYQSSDKCLLLLTTLRQLHPASETHGRQDIPVHRACNGFYRDSDKTEIGAQIESH